MIKIKLSQMLNLLYVAKIAYTIINIRNRAKCIAITYLMPTRTQLFTTLIDRYEQYQQLNNRKSVQNTRRVRRIVLLYAPNISINMAATTTFIRGIKKWMEQTYVCEHTGRHISNSTIELYLNIIHAIFNYAQRTDIIRNNPFDALSRNELRMKKSNNRAMLTKAELQRIATVDDSNLINIKRAFLFACLTGLRLSDVRTLKWKDIAMTTTNTMFVTKLIVKTDKWITIPLNRDAQKLVGQRRKETDYIFALPKSNSTIGCQLRKLAKNACVNKKITFHVARHTFATCIMQATNNINTTRELLGHSDIRTTQNYLHTTDEYLLQAVSALPKLRIEVA